MSKLVGGAVAKLDPKDLSDRRARRVRNRYRLTVGLLLTGNNKPEGHHARTRTASAYRFWMIRSSKRYIKQTICRFVNAGMSNFDSVRFIGLPFRILSDTSNKALSAEKLFTADPKSWQSHLVIDP